MEWEAAAPFGVLPPHHAVIFTAIKRSLVIYYA